MNWIIKGIRFLFTIDSWEYVQRVITMEYNIAHMYFGTGIYIIFYLMAFVFLLWKCPKLRKNLLFPILFLLILYIVPKTSSFLVAYMFESGNVYWRYFWLLHVNLIIAIAMVEFCCEKARVRWILVILCVFLLITEGRFIFTKENYNKADNIYKLPQEVIEICKIISADSGEEYSVENITVAPTEVSQWIRTYDGGICLLYGRYANETYTKNKDTEYINAYLSYKIGNVVECFELIEDNNCRYLVVSTDERDIQEAKERKYHLLGRTGEYLVYRIPE